MVIVGRPTDPVHGTSLGIKLAALVIFLALALGGGLALLLEFISTKIRIKDEVESITGLPVVARLSRLPEQA